jgi:hypothetical protein
MALSLTKSSLDRRLPRIRIVLADHQPDRLAMGAALVPGRVVR